MSDKSKIEWTDASWNPIRARMYAKVGWHCEKVSAACTNCYAEAMNMRLGNRVAYRDSHIKRDVFLDEKTLLQPLKWTRPRKIFVCSMTDLFGEWVSDEMIDRIFAVMALCPQHTFQVLTKRPERMREYICGPYPNGEGVAARIAGATWALAPSRKELPDPPVILEMPVGLRLESGEPEFGWRRIIAARSWPLKNVWLGVTAENQEMADKRIPLLLATPAALRWVSIEPMLGSVDLEPWLDWPIGSAEQSEVDGHSWGCQECESYSNCKCPRDKAYYHCEEGPRGLDGCPEWIGVDRITLDWIVAGGESGPHARPSHPDWFRSLRDQCAAAGVPFLFKQWGEYGPCELYPAGKAVCSVIASDGTHLTGSAAVTGFPEDRHAEIISKFGKVTAGRELDGVEHNAFPEAQA